MQTISFGAQQGRKGVESFKLISHSELHKEDASTHAGHGSNSAKCSDLVVISLRMNER